MRKWLVVVFLLLHSNTVIESRSTVSVNSTGLSVDWVVDIPGGNEDAIAIAKLLDINLLKKISLGNTHGELFQFTANLKETEVQRVSQSLSVDSRVNWASKQIALRRERKSVLPLIEKHRNLKRSTSNKNDHPDMNCVCKNITSYPDETFGTHVYDVMSRQSDASLSNMFNDPKWPCQWELYNCGQTSGPHRVDLNVVPCWEKGFTGKGIVVTVLDDARSWVQNVKDTIELHGAKYVTIEFPLDRTGRVYTTTYIPSMQASADLNDNLSNNGPLPNKDRFGNDHGTKCGGEIAMRPNNNFCGVGVAYDATLGGIRFLDGTVTDASEAAALVFNADFIDIYSCSWGPQDNGESWEGPGRLASAALEVGSTEGREGRGSIYVWAAGNGGASGDHCGADGYTCSIYTIGIASVSHQGLSTFYTESCTCIMAVTLNGGPHRMSGNLEEYRPVHYLVTTDPYKGCVDTFSGTSSAAPLASGIVALVLQANPSLTWRDIQHLIVRNSKIPNPTEDGWTINGAGFHVHHKYGFGLMDAARLVMAAQSWKTVTKQKRCEVMFPSSKRFVRANGNLLLKGLTSACAKSVDRVDQLEHVQVVMSYNAQCRGDVSIELISPCGTKSELMATRKFDASKEPVIEWPFMTVHNWGEVPRGVWSVKIKDNKGSVPDCARPNHENIGIHVSQVRIIFWGTSDNKRSTHDCHNHLSAELENLAEDNKLYREIKNSNSHDDIAQKVINSQFLGEQYHDVTAFNLKQAKERKESKLHDDEDSIEKQTDLRHRLFNFLMRNSEIGEQSLRNAVHLTRTIKKNVEQRSQSKKRTNSYNHK